MVEKSVNIENLNKEVQKMLEERKESESYEK